jgi:hypothetical protein
VVRQVLHRPLDNSQAGSNVLVISSYDAGSGELLMRAKQRCTFVRAGMKVTWMRVGLLFAMPLCAVLLLLQHFMQVCGSVLLRV